VRVGNLTQGTYYFFDPALLCSQKMMITITVVPPGARGFAVDGFFIKKKI
jgi:hypothetical protein